MGRNIDCEGREFARKSEGLKELVWKMGRKVDTECVTQFFSSTGRRRQENKGVRGCSVFQPKDPIMYYDGDCPGWRVKSDRSGVLTDLENRRDQRTGDHRQSRSQKCSVSNRKKYIKID